MIKDLLLIIGGMVLFIAISTLLIITPIAYFDGKAKSDWLRQTRGVDLPWYRATWLNVQINDVDAEMRLK